MTDRITNEFDNTTVVPFSPDPSKPLAYFRSIPEYSRSPLNRLRTLDDLDFLVKDESHRMGLGAFKALGGPYAVFCLICDSWRDRTGETIGPDRFVDVDIHTFAAALTFVCASAGNHGLGVAAGAKAVGANARIYLARSVPASFERRLNEFGAEVIRAGESYDESVAESIDDAQNTGATLLADGSWPGYTTIPRLVMEGYTVIAEELRESFEESGHWPSHVYIQAGVGGLAAAMAHMIRSSWAKQPVLIVVEPDSATCLKSSAQAGQIVRIDGPASNMGRLDCKQPSLIAWQTLERCDVRYSTVSDEDAARAAGQLKLLGIPTSPSGAAGYAALDRHQDSHRADDFFLPLVLVTESAV